jgi:hypothetical protein
MNHDAASVRNNFEFLKILSALSSTGKLHVLSADALYGEGVFRERESVPLEIK